MTQHSLFDNDNCKITEGATYILDGKKFKCLSISEDMGKFQELNEDGTPYRQHGSFGNGDKYVQDWGIRLIGLRLNEMIKV